jgi:phosphatidylglycerophosphate synthase
MATVDPRGVLGDLGAALALTLGAVGASWWFSGAPASYLLIGAAVFGALAALLMGTLPADLPGPGIGLANRVTLVRAALSVPAFAFAFLPEPIDVAGLWWVIGLSTAAMILDGVDGRVARRTGSHTSFGARFDMELDAALIMALSVLVWRSGKVGAWALLIGLMRYAFVAAGWIWPVLRAELPPSMRRKAVCVIQGVVLLVGLGPIVPPTLAAAVVAVGLAALTWSFAVDVRWSLVTGRSVGD